MKRAMFVAIPAMVALALAAAVGAAVTGFPVAAQRELTQYIQYVEPSGQATTIVEATRPWNLDPAWGFPVFGESEYFDTDERYLPSTSEATPLPMGQIPISYHIEFMPASGRNPLPFPPPELWCVALHTRDAERVLLVARHHEEPYSVDWVVHQGPASPFNAELIDRVSRLGCSLGLDSDS